ncbi:MAG: glycosyltransferase family 2 protein [Deltaproteobacteria bacterium]|nr:glycosyltransferase family 2 protein [Deltaproteobacteria bacterium]
MAAIVFWVSVGLIAYAYVGYPLLIAMLSSFVHRKVKAAPIEPQVSLLIAAYNEEKDIAEKLRNSLELDYPADRYEIVVASDGSTDRTDDIVCSFANNERGVRVLLHRVEGRLGKTAAQNSAVAICQGEVVVFSDAASLYDPGVLCALVRNYADPEVGAVSGRYAYVNKTGGSVGAATILFWNIENFIKSRQTRVRTITGCCGCIYSVRRSLYNPLPPTIISDLVEPLTILRKGKRIVFEPAALAFEDTTEKVKDEFKMRIRVIVRGMNGILFVRDLLNPLRYPFVALQLLSHKVLRWLVPVFSIGALLSNSILWRHSAFYAGTLVLQLLFYLLAAAGFLLERRGVHKKVLSLPLYFCVVNLASLLSLFRVLRGYNVVTWQTQR